MRTLMFVLALVVSAPALAQEEAEAPVKLDRSHPDYVRCETMTSVGNRARRERICKTNAEWKRLAQNNNAVAREVQEKNVTLSSPSN
jgi:hypothetical protein